MKTIFAVIMLPEIHTMPYLAINMAVGYIVFTAIILKVFRFMKDKNID